MEFLNNEFLNNPLYLWLIALVAALLFFFAFIIMRNRIISRIAAAEAAAAQAAVQAAAQTVASQGSTGPQPAVPWHPKNILEAFLIGIAVHTRAYFVFAVALYIGSLIVDLPAPIENILEMLVITTLLLQFGVWGTNLITYWVNMRVRQELERNNTNATTLNGLALVARIVLWSVLGLMILENVTGIEINTLVASLGITGIAVALAVQNILGDLFASLSITLDRPFVIGDFIIIGEYSGTVEHIGLKSTRVRSLSGEQLIFSNSDLLGSRIRNFKRMERRRVVFTLDLTYHTPPDKIAMVPEMVKEMILRHPQVTFDRAHFKEIRQGSLHFEIVYFIETPDYLVYMDTQQAFNTEIFQRFAQEGIEFAYPEQVVYVKEPSSNGKEITA